MNLFVCCKGCTERHSGCHDTCEKYGKAKEFNEHIKAERHKHNKEIAWVIDRAEAINKRMKRKKR